MKFQDVFHKLEKGVAHECSEQEWKDSESGLAWTIIHSRVRDYEVRTYFASRQRLNLSASERARPLQILVAGPFGKHWVRQADFPHRVVYDRIEDVEGAKLVHFGLVRLLEKMTDEKAESWMARRAVHDCYWNPDDECPPTDPECRVVDDRDATDPVGGRR